MGPTNIRYMWLNSDRRVWQTARVRGAVFQTMNQARVKPPLIFSPTWVGLLGLVSSTRCSRSDVSPLFLDQMPKWPQYHLRHQICQTGKIIEMTDPTEPTHPSLQGAREVIGWIPATATQCIALYCALCLLCALALHCAVDLRQIIHWQLTTGVPVSTAPPPQQCRTALKAPMCQ